MQLTYRWNLFLWRSRKWKEECADRRIVDAHRLLRPRRHPWTLRGSCWRPQQLHSTRATTLASCPASILIPRRGSRPSWKQQVKRIKKKKRPRVFLISFSFAGIGKLTGGDSKRLGDQEVLSRLTSSVSCALDEAAAALTRMRSENSSNFHQEGRY